MLRDQNGIVNIYADNPHDLFLAQGYVHAQERLWQMEVWRHISARSAVGALRRRARSTRTASSGRSAGARPPSGTSRRSRGRPRAALDAYAEGVNAYIDEHQGDLGLAFVVTGFQSGTGGVGGYDVEPWTALDSLAWQKVQAWQLGGNFDTEIFRMLADEHLGDPALTDQLFPPYWDTMPVITPSAAAGGSGRRGRPRSPGAARRARPAAATIGAGRPRRRRWRDVVAAGVGVSRLPASTAAAGWPATTRSDRTTGSLGPSMTERRARCWPTTRTSASGCPRSGS